MPHLVLCPICQKKFDRDAERYVLYSTRRYAHATCALSLAEKSGKQAPKIIDPTEDVKCDYCGKYLKKTEPCCVEFRKGHYAHKGCLEIEERRELTDEEKLYKYINEKMYNTDFVSPLIQRQIKNYIKDYNYSYSGMLKALIYGIEISKKFKPDVNYQTIAFLPYIYQEAYNYYYSLWLAEQANNTKVIKSPDVEYITINAPQRKNIKQKFLSILEDNLNDI